MHLYRNELDVYIDRLSIDLGKKYKKVQFKIIGEATNDLVIQIFINIDIRCLGLHKTFVVDPLEFSRMCEIDYYIKETIEDSVCKMILKYFIN